MPGYRLSGTTCVVAGESVQLTIDVAGTVPSDTLTPSDGAGGGTFSPSSIPVTGSTTRAAIVYSNATPGTYSLSLTSAQGYPVSGGPLPMVVVATPSSQAWKRRHRWFPGLRY